MGRKTDSAHEAVIDVFKAGIEDKDLGIDPIGDYNRNYEKPHFTEHIKTCRKKQKT